MPNRLLREGICTSDAINNLSTEEEVLFYRLLVVADDYGHCDGRVSILKAHCFPLRDSASPAVVEKWLGGLITKGMARRYEIGGKSYLAILKWEARVRTHPKHPLPTDDGARWVDGESPPSDSNLSADCGHTADRSLPIDRLGKGKGKGKGARTDVVRGVRTSIPPDFQVGERVKSWAEKQHFGKLDEHLEAFKRKVAAKGYQYIDWDAAFMEAIREDWAKLRDGKDAGDESWRKALKLA